MFEQWKVRVRDLTRTIFALYLSYKDPRTPFVAKLIIGLVVAYALSPIDLIPDFIPVLGYLDDLVLLPAGIWLALKLVPGKVFEEAKIRANQALQKPSPNYSMAILFIFIWVIISFYFLRAGWYYFSKSKGG